MRALTTIGLLLAANIFMNFAWYGHLQFQKWGWLKSNSFWIALFLSWFLAFFEYILQVPANKIGYQNNGGPFSLMELKTIQEVLSLSVFFIINVLIFQEKISWNQVLGFLIMGIGVWLVFKK